MRVPGSCGRRARLRADGLDACRWPCRRETTPAHCPSILAAPLAAWLLCALSCPRPLYTLPETTGRSMSPPMKPTSTSWPTRGVKLAPQLAPAQASLTRTQVPLCVAGRGVAAGAVVHAVAGVVSALPMKLHLDAVVAVGVNWARLLPTTSAVCTPCTVGRGCRRTSGRPCASRALRRTGSAAGCSVRVLLYTGSSVTLGEAGAASCWSCAIAPSRESTCALWSARRLLRARWCAPRMMNSSSAAPSIVHRMLDKREARGRVRQRAGCRARGPGGAVRPAPASGAAPGAGLARCLRRRTGRARR